MKNEISNLIGGGALLPLFFFVLALIIPSAISALPVYSTSECETISDPEWKDGYRHINYYLHDQFADNLSDCSTNEDYEDYLSLFLVSGIVKNAAEVWNAQFRSNALIYRGHRSASTYDEFCDDDTIETPAILVAYRKGCVLSGCSWEDCPFDGDAGVDCGCSPANCENFWGAFRSSSSCDDRGLVTINANNDQSHGCGSDPFDWITEADADPSEDRLVLPGLLHEIGHALGLGHPDPTVTGLSVMLGNSGRRHLNGRIHYTYFRVNSSDEIEWQGDAWTRSGSLTASHVTAGYFADTFWLGWKRWTHPQRVSWSRNQGSYADWTSEETITRAKIVDPPSFSYDPTSPSGGAEMVWTESID